MPKGSLLDALRGMLPSAPVPADNTAVRGGRPAEPVNPEVRRQQVLDEAAKMIESHEGFRSKAYRDPAGYLTTGMGQRISRDTGTQTTREEARRFLMGRVTEDAANLERRGIPLSPGVLSAAYNLGRGNLGKYGVLSALRAGEYDKAADILEGATRAGGRVLPGLVRRRQEEAMSIRKSDPNDPFGLFRPVR